MIPNQRLRLGSENDNPTKTTGRDMQLSKKIDDCHVKPLFATCKYSVSENTSLSVECQLEDGCPSMGTNPWQKMYGMRSKFRFETDRVTLSSRAFGLCGSVAEALALINAYKRGSALKEIIAAGLK